MAGRQLTSRATRPGYYSGGGSTEHDTERFSGSNALLEKLTLSYEHPCSQTRDPRPDFARSPQCENADCCRRTTHKHLRRQRKAGFCPEIVHAAADKNLDVNAHACLKLKDNLITRRRASPQPDTLTACAKQNDPCWKGLSRTVSLQTRIVSKR